MGSKYDYSGNPLNPHNDDDKSYRIVKSIVRVPWIQKLRSPLQRIQSCSKSKIPCLELSDVYSEHVRIQLLCFHYHNGRKSAFVISRLSVHSAMFQSPSSQSDVSWTVGELDFFARFDEAFRWTGRKLASNLTAMSQNVPHCARLDKGTLLLPPPTLCILCVWKCIYFCWFYVLILFTSSFCVFICLPTHLPYLALTAVCYVEVRELSSMNNSMRHWLRTSMFFVGFFFWSVLWL